MPARSAPREAQLSAPREAQIPALRRQIARLEARAHGLDGAAAPLAIGVPAIDAVLGGGLARHGLHEIGSGSEAELAAATGFTLALAALAAATHPVVWVVDDASRLESGTLHGPGAAEIGVPPQQLLIVPAPHPRDVLWAMEEVARSARIGAVIGEFRRPGAVDLVASRRLSLAASRAGALAIVLRAIPDPRPLSATTRWMIGAARARSAPHALGPPAFDVRLIRNRFGPGGAWALEWNRAEQRFAILTAHPEPVVLTPADRPRRAVVA